MAHQYASNGSTFCGRGRCNDWIAGDAATTFGHTANMPFDPGIVLMSPLCEGMNVCKNISRGRNDVYSRGASVRQMAAHFAVEDDVMT